MHNMYCRPFFSVDFQKIDQYLAYDDCIEIINENVE